jgi:hypothetical protein
MGLRRMSTLLIILTTLLGGASLWMTGRYLTLYKMTMQTEVQIEILQVDIEEPPYTLHLRFFITNPISDPFEVEAIVYEIRLNREYLTHGLIKGDFEVGRGKNATIEHIVEIPEARDFTLRKAEEQGTWLWTISGSLHITTYIGETRIRFSSIIPFIP